MNARQILPGATYLVTRRCTQRFFLLKPSHRVRQIFLYCLAFAASRTGVQIHAVVVMSNHYHLVVTDPRGLLPLFAEYLNKFVAKCLNAAYGRWENFWAANQPTSYVRLADEGAVLDKMAYTLCNPVLSGLVPYRSEWPGVLLGEPGTLEITRPEGFFREAGPMPEVLTLEISAPPAGQAAPEEYWRRVTEAADATEAEARQKMAREKRRFLGVKAIMRQSIYDSPKTPAPRRRLSPLIACKDLAQRVLELAMCREWLRAYREALRAWRRADRDAIFPPGTYGMRAWHAARCAES